MRLGNVDVIIQQKKQQQQPKHQPQQQQLQQQKLLQQQQQQQQQQRQQQKNKLDSPNGSSDDGNLAALGVNSGLGAMMATGGIDLGDLAQELDQDEFDGPNMLNDKTTAKESYKRCSLCVKIRVINELYSTLRCIRCHQQFLRYAHINELFNTK